MREQRVMLEEERQKKMQMGRQLLCLMPFDMIPETPECIRQMEHNYSVIHLHEMYTWIESKHCVCLETDDCVSAQETICRLWWMHATLLLTF